MKTLADARDVRSRVLRAARTVIWAAGVCASPPAEALADESGAESDQHGGIGVDDHLTLPGHPEVFAIGDMARLGGVSRRRARRDAGGPPRGPHDPAAGSRC